MIRKLLGAAAVAVAAVGFAPSAGAEPLNDLWPLLPVGYRPDNCQPGEPAGGALAMVHCQRPEHGLPGGPTNAHFALTTSAKAAQGGWNDTFAGKSPGLPFTAVECPGSGGIRGTWESGLVACGTNQDGTPYLMYTNGPMFATVFGDNIADVFTWWLRAAVPH